MKTLTLKNAHVSGLASWLNQLQLHGQQSRVRSRFVKNLVDRYQENEKFRKEMLDKYAKKDKKGEIVLSEDKKTVVLKDQEKFVKELQDLYLENYVTQIDGESYNVLKDIILKTTYRFGPSENDSPELRMEKIRQANDYEEWCEVLEKCE